jgi:hypothetical protein
MSVLSELVEARKKTADRWARRRSVSVSREILRFVSIAAMAVAIYRYHALLFSAVQPYINRLYSFLTGR